MLRPKLLKKLDGLTLGIVWEDGHESIYDTTFLRNQCSCATCCDEWTGERKIKALSLPSLVRPVVIDSVGQYGLKIRWSDGHSQGIYTYENLKTLCQCSQCRR